MTTAQGASMSSIGPMIARNGVAAALISLLAVVGCTGGSRATQTAAAPSLGPTAAAIVTQPPPPTASPPPALVGTWDGVHNCQRIVELLHAADLDSQILPTIVGNGLLPGVTDPADVQDPDKPCVGAIEIEHAHFFTAAGEFGSLDQDGNRVDDGTWSIVDATTFAINDVPFHYQVTGNELRLEPTDVGACPADPAEWCVEAWKVMVAMPGMAWSRRE